MPPVAYSQSPIRNVMMIAFFVLLMVIFTAVLGAQANVHTPDRVPGSGVFLYGMAGFIDLMLLIVIAVLVWVIFKQRSMQPRLILDDTGITMKGFNGTIPWDDILTADVMRMRWAAHVFVKLALKDEDARYADLMRSLPVATQQMVAANALVGAAKFNVVLTDMGVAPKAFFEQMNERRGRLGLSPLVSATGY